MSVAPLASAAAGSAEYAHARLRARWGARADETAWHRIEITRELAPVLDLARAGPLSRWTEGVAAGDTVHAIECTLRERWCHAVHEVVRWMGGEWQAAVRWCAWLPLLPAAQQRARGDPPASWAVADAALARGPAGERAMPASGSKGASAVSGQAPASTAPAAHGAGPQGRALADADAPAWQALLDAARADPSQVSALWLRTWRSRLPRGRERRTIEQEFVPLLLAHAAHFASPATVDGWAARRVLAAQLVALMRRHPAEPLEAFAFLALWGLELERLRAEIVARAAFPRRTLHA
ncbi:MAG: hypothetical protein JNJ89_17725 [Rubrivivax sp.]|nr:hypothetical protein [Rubrivivax sp.]